MTSFLFILRFTARWFAVAMVVALMLAETLRNRVQWLPPTLVVIAVLYALHAAYSHVRRVSLMADKVDGSMLGVRHRRQVEIPLPPSEAFDMVEAAIRELPQLLELETARDSLQLRARVRRQDPYSWGRKEFRDRINEAAEQAGAKVTNAKLKQLEQLRELEALAPRHRQVNQVAAFVKPGDRSSSLILICGPEGGALVDWFKLDHGTNWENAEAITRAITRRIAERRRGEEAVVHATATDKELAEARLSMLHAQVEPHFLYNTLASAQVLTRSDPNRADQMLGHLISYLRNSLPRDSAEMSTLGEELDRTRAYLEIMKIRMGERLQLQIQVPEALKGVPMPPMMLQTLVENAIKHGLEPVPGGGTVWVIARETEGKVAVTVADDGRGFSDEGGGTGIGLRNVRERLKLAFHDAAGFTIVGNFPKGVAATITVPREAANA